MKKLLGLILSVLLLLSPMLLLQGVFPQEAKAAVTVSRLVKTPEGKGYLEVDGKPFLFGYVENWGTQQIKGDSTDSDWRWNTAPFSTPMPLSWMTNVFEKTQALGYKTTAIMVRWNDIEPTTQGAYDWTVIDKYVDWANTYNQRIDIVWTGGIHCGGARLNGYQNGWMSWIPAYLQDKDRYFGKGINGNDDIYQAWIPDGGVHDADANFLFSCERNTVTAMMNHLATYDTSHRVITFQVENEPNVCLDWSTNKTAVLNILDELGKAVKTSNYSVMTRVNLTGTDFDNDVNNLQYIDCVGADPYTTSVSTIADIINSSGSDMPHLAENDGSCSNESSLALAAIVNGGFYSVFQLNDHFPPSGMYDASVTKYENWTLGTIPPKRHGGTDMTHLNTAMNKIGSLIAQTSKSKMTGYNIETDNPSSSYNSFRAVGTYNIGFACSDSSVGMGLVQDSYVYCISDTAGSVTFKTTQQPLSASVGYFDSNDIWVNQGSRSYASNGDGTYSLTYNTNECLRIQLPPSHLNPIGYWKLDETSGSTTADTSGNGQNGTLYNTPAWGTGKVNNALNFNGSNQYVSTSWGQLTGNSARSISVWFKTSSASNSNWVSWGADASNQLSQIGIFNGGLGYLGYANDLTTPASTYADGNWHHLAVTFDGSNMYLYVDGVQKNSASKTLNTGNSSLNFGRSVKGTDYFNGSLDEILAYDRALSAAEVYCLTNINPIGYWKLDETSGSTTADTSGNGRNGTLYNSPSWGTGKVNSALSFNGSNQYVSASWGQLTGNAARSVSVWFKTTSASNSNWLSWGVNANNQLSQLGIFNGGLGYLGYANDLTTPASTYTDGNWHHLAVTFDGSNMYLYVDGVQKNSASKTLNTGNSSLNFGRSIIGSGYFNGSVDEVLIYGRALSAAEVYYLANISPIGYWKLDETSGSTAADSSGNGRNGTLYNSPSWGTGKVNSALSFNGSNQYVSTSWGQLTGNSARSISVWFKTTSASNSNWLSWGADANNQLSQIGIFNGGLGYLGYANDLTTPASTYTDGNWHHLAVTFDGSNMYLYVDGVQKNSASKTLNTGNSSLNFGRSVKGSDYFNGVLDQVRIYNRELNLAEVQSLFNEN